MNRDVKRKLFKAFGLQPGTLVEVDKNGYVFKARVISQDGDWVFLQATGSGLVFKLAWWEQLENVRPVED